jgi:hypothetical protein
MTDDQLNAFVERFALSFEKIAGALEGLNETYRRHYEKLYPERKEVREAVVTRVQNEEDRIREAQGASVQPLNRWLSDVEDEEAESEFVGVREREWLDAQKRPDTTEKREGDHEGIEEGD